VREIQARVVHGLDHLDALSQHPLWHDAILAGGGWLGMTDQEAKIFIQILGAP
jgi:hypothetical protein